MDILPYEPNNSKSEPYQHPINPEPRNLHVLNPKPLNPKPRTLNPESQIES